MTIKIENRFNEELLYQQDDYMINNCSTQNGNFAYEWLRYHQNVTLMRAIDLGSTEMPYPKNRMIWECLDDHERHLFNVVFAFDATNDEQHKWKRIDLAFINYALNLRDKNNQMTWLVVNRPHCPSHKIWIGNLCNHRGFQDKGKMNFSIVVQPVNMESEVKA
jgi:hypothetical protein